MKGMVLVCLIAMTALATLSLVIWGSLPSEVRAQSGKPAIDAPKFEVDPFWPKPLPNHWVIGMVGGVCIDAQDHVFTVTRDEFLTHFEHNSAKLAPGVIEFDPEGNVVNSWGNRDSMPKELHGCFVDNEGNIWIAGNHDGIVQKYTHDGSKMLLQIGTRGKFDSADGSDSRKTEMLAMNSSHVFLNSPTDVAVDPTNGDVYISDGYGNCRVVVFDREGHYLRQWGRHGTLAEIEAGVGGAFLKSVHCVVIGKDGLVYVCDREGDRIQVFDKMGNFKRNILVESRAPHVNPGAAGWMAFSPDPTQKFIFVGDSSDAEMRVLDRATGQALSSFGQTGTQTGEFENPHTVAVDSKGDVIVGDTDGRRLQIWRLVR